MATKTPTRLIPIQVTTTLATDPITFIVTSPGHIAETSYLIYGAMYHVGGKKQFWRADFHALRIARVPGLISANSVAMFAFELGWSVPFENTTLLNTNVAYSFWEMTGVDLLEPDAGALTLFIMPYA